MPRMAAFSLFSFILPHIMFKEEKLNSLWCTFVESLRMSQGQWLHFLTGCFLKCEVAVCHRFGSESWVDTVEAVNCVTFLQSLLDLVSVFSRVWLWLEGVSPVYLRHGPN